jgi:hypothetical protein
LEGEVPGGARGRGARGVSMSALKAYRGLGTPGGSAAQGRGLLGSWGLLREPPGGSVLIYKAENTKPQGLKFIVLLTEDGTELLEIART